ncbi:ATP-binding protein, partial [Sphaerisporangium aureirubrum]
VLDNCEHVVDAVAELLQRVLPVAPGVRVLATSREPLGVPGEVLHPVPPLAVPGAGEGSPAKALTYPAVALFAARAAAVRPGFAVDGSTVADVVRVCRELDGIPLAIELAAARLRSLTPAQLVAAIGDRFAALGRGSRTADPRHRTLRSVIDWSWDLLPPAERVALRRLSVFSGGGAYSGGATAHAAAEVCGADLEVLSCLVDKSLVIAATTGEEVRYRLLESVRHYAAERLAEAGEQYAVRQAHAEYFLGVAERMEPRLRTERQLEAMAVLEEIRGELDAALEFAVPAGLARTALRLVAARLWWWVIQGRRREAAHWAAAAVRTAGTCPPPGLEAEHAMCLLLSAHETAGDTAREQVVARALEVVQERGHPATLGSWAIMGGYGTAVGDVRSRAEQAVRRFGEHPDAWTRATAGLVGAIVEFELTPGGAPRAEERLRTVLGVYRGLGERWGTAVALFWLSLVMENRGRPAEALALLEESAALAAEIGGTDGLPGPSMLPVRLGQLRARTGDPSGAVPGLERARASAERGGDLLALARTWHALGEISRRTGDHQEARTRLTRALDLLRTAALPPEEHLRGPDEYSRAGGGTPVAGMRGIVVPPQLVAFVFVELALVEVAAGEPGAARAAVRGALEAIDASEDDTARAAVLEGVAHWCLSDGDPARAALALGAAATLRGVPTGDQEVAALTRRCAARLGEAEYKTRYDLGSTLRRPPITAFLPDP